MSLIDEITRMQVLFQRTKSGIVRDASNNAGERLSELLAGVLANAELRGMTPSRLNQFLSSLRERIEEQLDAVFGELVPDLREVAVQMAEAEAEILEVEVPDRRSIPRQALEAEVQADDVPAETIGAIFAALVVNERRRTIQRLRAGAARAESNEALRQAVVGPSSRRNRGAVIGRTRRSVAAFADLAAQHVASAARRQVWLENNVSRYRWQSILDSRTCLQCAPLDGREFTVGQGPVDPLHPRCRCFSVPLTEAEVDRSRASRPSVDGEVPAELTYFEWLGRQPRDFQEAAIGPTRARLLRSGGLSATEFRRLQLDRNFEPLTLEEMRRLRPAAFERAGIE